jgi:hypothetical protein
MTARVAVDQDHRDGGVASPVERLGAALVSLEVGGERSAQAIVEPDRVFYSVAQHSVIVSRVVEERGGDVEDIFAALMHDAGEAYLGDMLEGVALIPRE